MHEDRGDRGLSLRAVFRAAVAWIAIGSATAAGSLAASETATSNGSPIRLAQGFPGGPDVPGIGQPGIPTVPGLPNPNRFPDPKLPQRDLPDRKLPPSDLPDAKLPSRDLPYQDNEKDKQADEDKQRDEADELTRQLMNPPTPRTQVRPPPGPFAPGTITRGGTPTETPGPPIGLTPPPPTIYGEELEDPEFCCGKMGAAITFPVITDPMPVTEWPVAPWDVAVGGFQVLLDRAAFFLNELDISVPALAFPIEWKRHYLSDLKITDGGVVGHGWDFSYNKRIVPMASRRLGNGLYFESDTEDARLTYYDGQGRGEIYVETHSEERTVNNFDASFRAYVTTYRSPPGQFHEIERYVVLGDHEDHPFKDHPNVEPLEQIFYVLREKNGTRLVFNCRGQMIYIVSRNDSTQNHVRVELQYNGPLNPLTQNKLLSLILDAKRRAYSVTPVFINQSSVFTNIECKLVTGTYPVPRIKRITGGGYNVEYTYAGNDTDPTLARVRVTTGDVQREWRYTSDGDHQITEVRDPVACAAGDSGKPYIVNTYTGGQVTAQNLAGMPLRLAYTQGRVTVTAADGSAKEFELEKIGPYTVAKTQTVRPADMRYGGPWSTRFTHNPATQVTRITFPRGNGVSYEYDGDNAPITRGPFRDWFERGWVYESDLSEGNLLKVSTFSDKQGDEPLVTSTTYDPLYNQTQAATDVRGATTIYDYSFTSPGERGNPVRVTFPPLERPDGSMVARPPEDYSYNASGQRIAANAGDGRVTRYYFNAQTSYLERIDYPSGARLDYQLSNRGEIMRESGTDVAVSYKRDGRGQMIEKIVDPGNNGANVRSTYRYDLNGRVVEAHTFVKDTFDTLLARLAKMSTGPEVDRRVTTEYDLLGRTLKETVTAGNLSNVTSYTYDNVGMMVSKTVPPLSASGTLTTRFTYDARGQVVETIEASGTPAALTTKITRDANGNETRVETSGGAVTATTTKEYDGFDRMTSSTDALGATAKYAYEKGGKVASIEVAGSKGPGAGSGVLRKSSMEYDIYGNLIRKAVDTLVDGAEESYWFYNKFLLVERAVAPSGGETTFEYDRDNRVTRTVDPLGNETLTTYNARGQATRITQNVNEQVLDPRSGSYTERKKSYITNQTFDALGNMVSVDGPGVKQYFFYNSANLMRGLYDQGEGLSVFTYDGFGRRQSIRSGDNFELNAYTPGGLIAETDSPSTHQAFEYDALGRTTAILDRNTNARTAMTYDGLGREIEREDPNGTVIRTKLNGQGLAESVSVEQASVMVNAAGRSLPGIGGITFENFDYDAVGRTVRARTNQQADVRFVYDGLDRAVEETQIFRSFGQTLKRRFATDASWREIDYPEITGRPTVRYSFDLLGRVEQVEVGNETIAAYTYTGADRIVRAVMGNGIETRYAFDDVTRASNISVSSPAGADGRAGASIWSVSASYRGLRPSTITETLQAPAGGVAPRTLVTQMVYDRSGRLTSSQTEAYTFPSRPSVDTPESSSSTYSSYERGRLKSSAEYVRDASGKIQTIKFDTLTYGPGSRVGSVATSGSVRADSTDLTNDIAAAKRVAEGTSGSISTNQAFLYDNNGNVLHDGRFIYAYDYKGRLVRVEDTWHPYNYDDSITFYYDSFDRRIYVAPDRDRVPTGLVRFGAEWDKHDQWHLYDGERLIAETWVRHPRAAQAVSLLARYFFGARPGERIRMDRRPEADPKAPFSSFYLHQDLHGQIKLLTNAGAQPTMARNLNLGAGAGGASTRPPEDAVMIAGTSIRMPYSSDATRIDGFAATVYREDAARALLDFRTDHDWGREIDSQVFRENIAVYQNRMLAVLGGITAIPFAAPFAITYVGGSTLAGSALIGGTLNLGFNAGTAIYTQSGYTLEEGVGNFSSGAISGMMGGVVHKAATGIVQELVLDYISNVAMDTYTGAVFNGQTWKDAFADGIVSGAYSTAIGFGTARIGDGLHWAGRRVSARINASSGAVRPDDPRGSRAAPAARSMTVTYLNRVTNATLRWLDLFLPRETFAITRELKNFEHQVIAYLLNGTYVSRELGKRLLSGGMEVRVSRFTEPTYYAVWQGDKNLHINSGMRMVDPRNGVRFGVMQSPLMFAALLVHEGIHALGGGELSAHVGQAQFLTVHQNVSRVRDNGIPARQSDIPLLDEGHLGLIDAWREHDLVKIAELTLDRGYEINHGPKVRVTKYNNGDAWVKSHTGGWGEVLGLQNDPLWPVVEARTRAANARMM